MKYNAIIIDDGYIIGVAITPFSDDRNADIIDDMLNHQPPAPEGFVYMLRADTLEWELVKLPEPEPIEEEATIEDYETALNELGVI